MHSAEGEDWRTFVSAIGRYSNDYKVRAVDSVADKSKYRCHMEQSRRITQCDLAEHLGISQITVSRALARSPLVPKRLQERVQEAALRLGYVPDPVLSRLNAYRKTKMPLLKGRTLAWISGFETRHRQSWYSAATKRAKNYGYLLTAIDPDERKLSFAQLMKTLYNRGIAGLIFAPRLEPQACLDIDLEKFCAVTIGYSIECPAIDRVITDHHYNFIAIYQKLIEKKLPTYWLCLLAQPEPAFGIPRNECMPPPAGNASGTGRDPSAYLRRVGGQHGKVADGMDSQVEAGCHYM